MTEESLERGKRLRNQIEELKYFFNSILKRAYNKDGFWIEIGGTGTASILADDDMNEEFNNILKNAIENVTTKKIEELEKEFSEL